MNKNSKFIKLVACESSQNLHFSYKKKWDILTSSKKKFHRNFIQIIIGLKIDHFKWNYTWG